MRTTRTNRLLTLLGAAMALAVVLLVLDVPGSRRPLPELPGSTDGPAASPGTTPAVAISATREPRASGQILGRCLSVEERSGLGGCEVYLLELPRLEVLDRRTSSHDGSYAIDLDRDGLRERLANVPSLAVGVTAPEGYAPASPTVVPVTDLGDPIDFLFRENQTQLSVCRVVDAVTREAVPFLTIEGLTVDAAYRETDALGTLLVSETALRTAEMALRDGSQREPVWIEPGTDGSKVQRMPDESLQITARIGPTYHFSLDSLAQEQTIGALRARIGVLSSEGLVRWRDWLQPRKESPGGSGLWIRYSRPYGDGGAGVIEVVAEEARLMGRQPVASTIGVYPRTLHIPMHGAGALKIHSPVDPNAPLAESLFWSIECTDCDPAEMPRLGQILPVEESAHVDGLQPGSWQVSLAVAGGEAISKVVSMRAGETATVEYVRRQPPGEGRIAGELISLAGRFRSSGWIFLQDLREEERCARSQRFRVLAGQEVDRLPFSFDGLPEGRYALMVRPEDGYEWRPRHPIEVETGAFVRLECVDDGEAVDIEFDAVDCISGEPIEGATVCYSINGVDDQFIRSNPTRPEIRGVADLERVAWGVFADGYAPAFGEGVDIRPGRKGTASVRVVLKRGWGAQLMMTTGPRVRILPHQRHYFSDALAPVAGVNALADGVLVGHSGEDGILRMSLSHEPQSLVFEHPDFVVREFVDRNPTTHGYLHGQLVGTRRLHPIYMEPRR